VSRFAIFLSGEFSWTPRLKAKLAGYRLIAADGGIRHLEGLKPELWVGDFDSSNPEAFPEVPRAVYRHEEKDATDGELAIRAALARGAEELALLGALGGRSDHALAHLSLALELARQGLRVWLSRGWEEAYPLVPGEFSLALEAGTLFSLIPWTLLSGLSLRGGRWSLEEAELPWGSRGVSNEAQGPLQIHLRQGQGILWVYPESR
jgi:thiamine pyrophosphokinase